MNCWVRCQLFRVKTKSAYKANEMGLILKTRVLAKVFIVMLVRKQGNKEKAYRVAVHFLATPTENRQRLEMPSVTCR